jgi:hypothetical protein
MKFDCSSLVAQVFRDAGNMAVPRTTSEIWARGRRINANQIQPGDIIVYTHNGRTPGHVSIVVDRNYMIHAVSTGSQTGVIHQRQNSGTWPQRVMGYVTFVGVNLPPSRSIRMPVYEMPLEITTTLTRNTEQLAVQKGTALTFDLLNATGRSGEFEVFFYRAGTSRASGDTETHRIINGEVLRTGIFRADELGQYRLEIRTGNSILLDYIFVVED